MPTGDFPPPKGMRWTDANGWIPDLPEEWGTIGGKPFNDELLEARAENERLRAALANIAEVEGDTMVGRRAMRALAPPTPTPGSGG